MAIDESVGAFLVPGFEAIRELGRGGMGVVYLARQVSLNRTVALKLLAPVAGIDPETQAARFRREAELLARCSSHPNVVMVLDHGVAADGRSYLVMEYIEGGDLNRRFPPGRPVPPGQLRGLVAAVSRALAHLHRAGILHRDLKPANILMRDGQTPKVADFGLAVLAEGTGDLTRSDLAMGTPGYTSPEQQYRLKVDERADQYALAAVVYELLAGRKPLGPYGPPSRYNPEVGPALDAAVLKGLSEDRDDRFATIEEFAEALDPALAAPAPTLVVAEPAPVPGGPKPGAAGPSRRPGAGWLVAGVLGLVVVVPRLLGPPGPLLEGPGRWPGPPGPAGAPPPAGPPALGPGPYVNSLEMTMVPIPPGSFLMGSPPGDPDAQPVERPAHRVRITGGFYLGGREVTVGQFRAFVEATGHRTEAEWSGRGGYVYNKDNPKHEKSKEITRIKATNWRNPGYNSKPSEDDPVVQVSHDDARAFCDWLARKEGLAYRLPSEAEWEHACRAGTSTRWSTGDDPRSLDDAAWTFRNAGDRIHPVGQKRPNPWGLYDMHGNAWEWCADVFAPYDPAPSTDPIGPADGEDRVLRGGSWDWSTTSTTRSAARLPYPRAHGYFTYGFRVALTPPRHPPPPGGWAPP